ncbi:helix-turn-helix domain-containing protein, partial [Streptomyces sp. NPDC059786]|uniref:helix-turn-helix domain-containing protein n=1 Tax=Streptomyces sp. NPDC059786 TaxID=3346946 RepID=UPI0036472DCF
SMPQWSDYSTGERIKILRGGSTQAELARRTGFSIVTIQKAEQDKTLSLQTLMALADALGCDTSVILGQQAPRRLMLPDDRRMMRQLSRAVHDTAAGLLPDEVESASLDDLADATTKCWALYWDGRYAEAGALAAPFIVSAAAHLHSQPADQQSQAWGALSDAYRIAAYVANLMGARDLAYAAIGHAQNAARNSDEMRVALVNSGRAWVYMRDARLPEALQLAEQSAVDIEPVFSKATTEQLAVYGAHVNFAAVVASRMGNKERAADYLSQSNATGVRMGREVRAHGTLFGPVSATTQAVGVNVSLGLSSKALKLIKGLKDTSALSTAALNRYEMDKALAYADAKLWDKSLETLEETLTRAPEWGRHQALPGVILQRVGKASTSKLRRVSKLIGVAPGVSSFEPATLKTAL